MEIQITEDITLVCEDCGRYLEGYQKSGVDRLLIIIPCDHCLEEAKNESKIR